MIFDSVVIMEYFIDNHCHLQKEKKNRAKTHLLPVRSRFDAAQTTPDNARHWSAADYFSADQEARPEVRKILRMRSRYEIANNSYAHGLVLMLSNDTIGTGPRLQMLSDNEEINERIEYQFARWSDTSRRAETLFLA